MFKNYDFFDVKLCLQISACPSCLPPPGLCFVFELLCFFLLFLSIRSKLLWQYAKVRLVQIFKRPFCIVVVVAVAAAAASAAAVVANAPHFANTTFACFPNAFRLLLLILLLLLLLLLAACLFCWLFSFWLCSFSFDIFCCCCCCCYFLCALPCCAFYYPFGIFKLVFIFTYKNFKGFFSRTPFFSFSLCHAHCSGPNSVLCCLYSRFFLLPCVLNKTFAVLVSVACLTPCKSIFYFSRIEVKIKDS